MPWWFWLILILVLIGPLLFLWFRLKVINRPRKVFRGGFADSRRGSTGHEDIYIPERNSPEPDIITDEDHPAQTVAPGDLGDESGLPRSGHAEEPPPGTVDDFRPPPPEPPGGFLEQLPKPEKRLPEVDD